MKGQHGHSRRIFLTRSALYGGALWMSLGALRPLALKAAQASTEPVSLSEAQWRTVEAITGRIIPTDQQPGAIEAQCVNFIDKVLAHEDAELKPTYEAGMSGIDSVSQEQFNNDFVALTADQQDLVLVALESGQAAGWSEKNVASEDFFETIRRHTIIGFLADPRYGGNLDYAGWKVMGYPGPRHHKGGYSPEQMVGEAPIIAVWGEKV
jgi:gluconate 2-dehydrogenase gamma chain